MICATFKFYYLTMERVSVKKNIHFNLKYEKLLSQSISSLL